MAILASLTFSASDWDTPRTVTGVDDSTDDGDQANTITTGICASSDLLYNGMNPADVLVTNTDDDGNDPAAGGGGFIDAIKKQKSDQQRIPGSDLTIANGYRKVGRQLR